MLKVHLTSRTDLVASLLSLSVVSDHRFGESSPPDETVETAEKSQHGQVYHKLQVHFPHYVYATCV